MQALQRLCAGSVEALPRLCRGFADGGPAIRQAGQPAEPRICLKALSKGSLQSPPPSLYWLSLSEGSVEALCRLRRGSVESQAGRQPASQQASKYSV